MLSLRLFTVLVIVAALGIGCERNSTSSTQPAPRGIGSGRDSSKNQTATPPPVMDDVSPVVTANIREKLSKLETSLDPLADG